MKRGLVLLVMVLALGGRAEWTGAEFVSVPRALNGYSADATSAFLRSVVNARTVERAVLRTTALGVYEAYVNGAPTEGFLKPGFTHVYRRRLETAADVTSLWRCAAGATNVLAALVTRGWWRDQINGRRGRDTGFRGILKLRYTDGSTETVVTDGSWIGGYAGPVVDAAIFDGEVYDARISTEWMKSGRAPADFRPVNICREDVGVITPMGAKAVALREDLAMKPVRAWVWKGGDGASDAAFGTVRTLRSYTGEVPLTLAPGETLVVDFGQNAAAVPRFTASAARGVTVTMYPAEMLNDAQGLKNRGCDGPEGSVYRANLRSARARAASIVAGEGAETYMTRFSYFGYRYVSIVADGEVAFQSLASVPVSSVTAPMENGSIETGDKSLNRFIANVTWGMRSNYLSVPTDCPQRDERLGWTADTQVFAPTALYLADCGDFLNAWMNDLVDSQHARGSYPSVAPLAQYGNEGPRIGWADAGVVVPWSVWRHTGKTDIIAAHWDSMMRFIRYIDESKYRTTWGDYQYADWLSFEPMETCRDGYWSCRDPKVFSWWNYLGACYWRQDALQMAEMARAIGRTDDADWCAASAERALRYVRTMLVDGRLPEAFRTFQTANLFALRLGVFTDASRAAEAKATLLKSIADRGNCLATGFLGTSFILDELTDLGEVSTAYSLLLNHGFPSWLYSVDQGATTVWERWNSYTKKDGFGFVGMNSFNHYAYGAVLAWLYRTAAGIAPDSKAPGFRNVIMSPKPDRRLGYLKASYRTPFGRIESAWRYEGATWIWTFTLPEGVTADVILPGETHTTRYTAGVHQVVTPCDGL